MKRRLLLLFVLFSMAFLTMAERIDVATARKIAENVAASNTGGLRSASKLSLIYAAAPGQEKMLCEVQELWKVRPIILCLISEQTRAS